MYIYTFTYILKHLKCIFKMKKVENTNTYTNTYTQIHLHIYIYIYTYTYTIIHIPILLNFLILLQGVPQNMTVGK